MAQHTTSDQGTLTIAVFGCSAGLAFGGAAIAINPRLAHAKAASGVLSITYGVGGWSETQQFSFASPNLALAAMRDFVKVCANALRAGDPAGGAVT